MRKLCTLLFLLALLGLAACAPSQSTLMAQTADDVRPFTPDPDKGTVVFMRPSKIGGAVQSTVYLYDKEPEFVGILSYGYKVAYQVTPGEHTFMVMGENADFLKLDIEAGTIRYVLVEPRWGTWKARFVLNEATEEAMDSFFLKEDLANCSFVANTPASLNWFAEHKDEVIALYDKYYPQWANGTMEKEDQATMMNSRMLPTHYAATECDLDAEKATIIFMRPSALGGYTESTIYLVNDNNPKFVGIVSMMTKVPYQVEPGKHSFMVMGANTAFMEADLAPGQVYYVIVEPHIGFIKTRFSLEPVTATQRETKEFKEDYASCILMTNGPDALNWFAENKENAVERYNSNYPKWKKKAKKDKSRLEKTDGRSL